MGKIIDFVEAIKKDPALQVKLEAVVKKHHGEKQDEAGREKLFTEEVAPIAQEAGFVISFAEMKALAKKAANKELSDEELAAVSGGKGKSLYPGGGTWWEEGLGLIIGIITV